LGDANGVAVSHFARELRQQPDAIRASLAAAHDAWREIARTAVDTDVDRMLVVGSGDSFYLGHVVAPAFEELAGVAAEGIEAYDLVTARLGAVSVRTLVAGISASGKSLRTLQAVALAARCGAFTVGVVNNAGSPLAEAARVALVTQAGLSYTFPTKATTAAAAVLTGLAATLGHARGRLGAEAYQAALAELAEDLPAAIEAVFTSPAMAQLAGTAAELASRRNIILVGSGASRAAALVGAAKFHETSHRQALAVNAEEYLHLVGFAVGAADAVIVIAPSSAAERERQVAEYAAKQGALVVSLVRAELADDWRDGQVVPLPTGGLAIWSGALVAMTALHVLAERFSQVLGTNPDRPDTVDLDYALGLLYTAPLEGW